MNCEQIIERLRYAMPEIIERFGVRSLGVFGSVSRNEHDPESDVDILVEFVGPATFDGYFDLKFYLEELLGRAVDLATDQAIRDPIRPAIEKDLIRVA
jgi:predicted nucleotidyltransferase